MIDSLANGRTSEDRRNRLLKWLDSPESTRSVYSTQNLAAVIMDLKFIVRYLIAENEELHKRCDVQVNHSHMDVTRFG